MADTITTTTQTVLKGIREKLTPVTENCYYLTRPNSFSEEVKRFVVISLPSKIRRTLSGYSGRQTATLGIIYAFSKAKTNNTPNIGDLASLSEDVEKTFPIRGDGFVCVRPDLQYMGDDGYGYQFSRISFQIYIK